MSILTAGVIIIGMFFAYAAVKAIADAMATAMAPNKCIHCPHCTRRENIK